MILIAIAANLNILSVWLCILSLSIQIRLDHHLSSFSRSSLEYNTFVLYFSEVILAEAYSQIKCNTLVLHKSYASKVRWQEVTMQLEVTPCMLLCRVKIRNCLLTLVLGIYSIFGLLCWQVQNISFTYWSIHVGKNGA